MTEELFTPILNLIRSPRPMGCLALVSRVFFLFDTIPLLRLCHDVSRPHNHKIEERYFTRFQFHHQHSTWFLSRSHLSCCSSPPRAMQRRSNPLNLRFAPPPTRIGENSFGCQTVLNLRRKICPSAYAVTQPTSKLIFVWNGLQSPIFKKL
jgi:hypothetical protein